MSADPNLQSESVQSKEVLKRTNRLLYLGASLICLIVFFSAGAAYYFYRQYNDLKQNPSEATKDQVSKLVADVSKILDVPDGETPTVATISDVDKLKGQPFFAKAKKGDKVLIYSNARKAILYDPVAHKIIEVAPLNINGQTSPTQ
jgi:hypothetical protein